MDRIAELVLRIEAANKAYYNGQAVISDEEYDALKDELRDLDPHHYLLFRVGETPSSAWQDRAHNIPMSSLDKVNSMEELVRWAEKMPADTFFSVQHKLDGISVSLDYEKGLLVAGITRGDGIVGEDITPNVMKMQGAHLKLLEEFTGSIRGEIILFVDDWKDHFSDMSNPRNAASGLSRRQEGSGQEHLHILCYDVVGDIDFDTESDKLDFLKRLGFQMGNSYCVQLDKINDIYARYAEHDRGKLPYEIDGLVIKVNDLDVQYSLGRAGDRENAKPKGQIALKFAHEMRESITEGIDWQVGSTGRITPVAYFNPVLIGGVEVKKASLYNVAYIKEVGISKGATILVSRRNDVIPRVEKVIAAGLEETVIPTECPVCNTEIKLDGEYLQCPNESCPARTKGNIEKWLINIDVDEFGPKLISALYDKGLLRTVADLYDLTESQIASLDRMGEKSARNVLRNLHAKKDIPVHIVLGSLNIQGCGTRVFEKLVKAGLNSLDAIRTASIEDLMKIHGIGESLAVSIQEGLFLMSGVIDELSKRINILSVEPSRGVLAGKSFCFTGTLSRPRKELQQTVKDAGGEVKSGVSSDLDYLVSNDSNGTGSKIKRAKKLGVQVIGEDKLNALIKTQ